MPGERGTRHGSTLLSRSWRPGATFPARGIGVLVGCRRSCLMSAVHPLHHRPVGNLAKEHPAIVRSVVRLVRQGCRLPRGRCAVTAAGRPGIRLVEYGECAQPGGQPDRRLGRTRRCCRWRRHAQAHPHRRACQRCGSRAHFPATSALFAPLWVIERGVCAWWAVLQKLQGGARYGGVRIARATSST